LEIYDDQVLYGRNRYSLDSRAHNTKLQALTDLGAIRFLCGVDDLIQLRGLNCFTVELCRGVRPFSENQQKTMDAEVELFAEHVRKLVILPVLKARVSITITQSMAQTNGFLRTLVNGWLQKITKVKRGVKAAEYDDDESEADGDEEEADYVPRPTRTRALKSVAATVNAGPATG
jgi:hypothetical protein